MKASSQRVLRAICNVYGLMLLAYPDDFRSKYGREMLLALRNRAHDVLELENKDSQPLDRVSRDDR